MVETCLLTMWCPVYRWHDSDLGSGTELENLVCDGKGKGTSGRTVRPKVLKRKPGSDYSIVVMKQGNASGAKGVAHPRCDRLRSTGDRRNRAVMTEGGSLH
jgi:hypothetical protein